jgi:hypothetical protein
VGSSPGLFLSGGGTKTWHSTTRLRLWAMAGGGSKDRTSSGTDQVGAVEVIDGWQGIGPTGEGLQRRGDGTTDAFRV